MTLITRRNLLVTGSAALVTGCDAISRDPVGREVLEGGGKLHQDFHRILGGRTSLAREFRPDQRSPKFRVNGTADPGTPEYSNHYISGFADWRLQVRGLVTRPLSISLAQLRAMPQRAQITRHDCVEGWSAIGKWQGPRLAPLLEAAGLRDKAKYIVFHCADRMRGGTVPYYESIDLIDALHPQTILAWALNDKPLSIGHGAPIRLRVERQLGYKQAKYIMAIEAVESLAGIGRGLGGYWEDWAGYEWYAGI
jgi:DMSO/TMAO reductase YedYZ molybdopterin-dependent catalytic subunit